MKVLMNAWHIIRPPAIYLAGQLPSVKARATALDEVVLLVSGVYISVGHSFEETSAYYMQNIRMYWQKNLRVHADLLHVHAHERKEKTSAWPTLTDTGSNQ